jgi:hypothetical protein
VTPSVPDRKPAGTLSGAEQEMLTIVVHGRASHEGTTAERAASALSASI